MNTCSVSLAERSEIDMLVRYSLSDYIGAAIATSEIEQLEDGSYVGRIPDCQGVIAFGDSLESMVYQQNRLTIPSDFER